MKNKCEMCFKECWGLCCSLKCAREYRIEVDEYLKKKYGREL